VFNIRPITNTIQAFHPKQYLPFDKFNCNMLTDSFQIINQLISGGTMHKNIVYYVLFVLLFLLTSTAVAQSAEDSYVVQVQTWKLKDQPMGDDARAFNDWMRKQAEVFNKDSRVLRAYTLRHLWGADSRDLIFIAEYKNLDDLLSFSDDFFSLIEEAVSKEELDKGNAIWNKYVGHHSDEIYAQTPGTRK
jgi:hypothetical protein